MKEIIEKIIDIPLALIVVVTALVISLCICSLTAYNISCMLTESQHCSTWVGDE